MTVLGVVRWTNLDKRGERIAGVEPLCEITKAEWRRIDSGDEFPTKGQAFWPAASEAVENALVYFRAEPNPGQKDEFRVVDPQPAFEIIDLRSLGGPVEVRATLAEGLRRSAVPVGRVLVWCAPDLLVGPVKLVRSPTGIVTFDKSNRDKIPTFAALNPRRIIDGKHERLLRTDERSPTGYVDWDSDELIVKRALKAAVALAKKAGKDNGQTQRQIEEAAEAIVARGVGAEAQLDLYRMERARVLCANSGLLAQLGPDLLEELRAHPSVAADIASILVQARRDAEITARAEAEQLLGREREALRELTSSRDRLKGELAAGERRLDELRKEVAAIEQNASRAAEQVEAAVSERVRSALERPAELLAEASVLRPLLGHPQKVGTPSPTTSRNWRPALRWTRTSADAISDRAALQRALKAAAQARGVSPGSLLQLHATVAAGLVPVAIGPAALTALAAFAHAACGARMSVLHTSPAFIQPQDLLGTYSGGAFEPHAAGLLSAGAAAQEVDALSLLVLEGANRSPLEASLLPVLQLREAGLPLLAPQLPEAVVIPSCLRLVATIVAGATTVPVTPQLWCYAVAIEFEPGPVVLGATNPTEVAMTSDLVAPGDPPREAVESLIEAWPDCADLRGALERYGAALSRLYSEGPRVRAALLEGIVLPFLVSTAGEDEQEEALTKLAPAGDTTLALAAKRLRKRLR